MSYIFVISSFSCPLGMWRCNDGECIQEKYRCSDITECKDKSDRQNCSSCSPDAWRCDDNVCIEIEARCDGVIDCIGGSDEINCTSCPPGSWRCGDGSCLRKKYRCDGFTFCDDQSDEMDCDLCSEYSFRCNNGQCIFRADVCDGIITCLDKSDELNCSDCQPHAFRCNNGKCIEKKKNVTAFIIVPTVVMNLIARCDGEINCYDKSDEINCSKRQSRSWKCENKKYIEMHQRCDGELNCSDKSDEINCFCNETKLDIVINVVQPNDDTDIHFVKELLLEVGIDGSSVRVGTLLYTSDKRYHFNLNFFANKMDLFDAIDNISFFEIQKNDRINFIKFMRSMFIFKNGDRDNAHNIAILIIFNASSINYTQLVHDANIAKQEGNHIYAIEIGLNESNFLKDLVTEPSNDYLFHVANISNWMNVSRSLIESLCFKQYNAEKNKENSMISISTNPSTTLRQNIISCDSEHWRCNSGNCILLDYTCNGLYDCDDFSDESNCTLCGSHGWLCENNACLPATLRCDNIMHSVNGSDEHNCGATHKEIRNIDSESNIFEKNTLHQRKIFDIKNMEGKKIHRADAEHIFPIALSYLEYDIHYNPESDYITPKDNLPSVKVAE